MFSTSDNIENFVQHELNKIIDKAVLISESKNQKPLEILSPIDKFLTENKISINHIKNALKKFNQLYKLCKSKKIDKLNKYSVISHTINTYYVKKRFLKKLKRKYNFKIKKSKSKKKLIKKDKSAEEDESNLTPDNDDSVRDKIREQLELLRSCKKVENPFINLKTKITNVNISTNKSLNKRESIENIRSVPNFATVELNPNENGVENTESKKEKTGSPKPGPSSNTDNHVEGPSLNRPTENHVENNTECTTIVLKESNDSNVDLKISAEHSDESAHSKIKPTKTTDITKIKGWRNKQFLNGIEKIPDALDENSSTKFDANSMDFDTTQNEISAKSAFESAALDKFLTNSKLNISYEVPKLIAEEAISNVTGTIEDFNLNKKQNATNPTKTVLKSEKKLKAKTLAEKRKMLECNRRKDLLHEMEIYETSLLKQLRRDEKKHRTEMIENIRTSLTNQQMPVTRECWITAMKSDKNHSISQMIKYGKDNIRISGSYGGPLIYISNNTKQLQQPKSIRNGNYIIVDEVSCQEVESNPRPTTFEYGKDTSSNYKPGPLCKKPFLNELDADQWDTVVVKLPKITLQIHPVFGKRIDPKIEGYIQTHLSEKGFISDLWAKFACTAVTVDDKRDAKPPFDFPLKYANDQQKVLMRKRKLIVPNKPELFDYNSNSESNTSDSVITKDNENIEYEVKKLMENILRYLEIPDLNNSNIPYCPDCPKFTEQNKSDLLTPVHNDIHAIIPASNKRKSANLKTERELKRLNVQVIEVDMESEPKNKKSRTEQCPKMQCRLGCVCNDPSVEWPQHCGRESCVLKCECRSLKLADRPKGHHYIKLPEGADLLSAETVGQIQDEAKRNLAKEERKFTQTVIKANDQTIVIGEGCREKRRRVTKLPQKYDDFVKLSPEIKKGRSRSPSPMVDDQEDVKTSPTKQRLWESDNVPAPKRIKKDEPPVVLKQEIVPLIENMMQLKNVIPWCMVHNLYKCFCNGQALEDTLAISKVKKVVEKEESKSGFDEEKDYISYTSKRSYLVSNSFAHSELNICARVRGVPNFYLARNKSQYFKTRNSEILQKEQQNLSFDHANDDFENRHRYFKEIGQCSSPDLVIIDPNMKPVIGVSPQIEPECPVRKSSSNKRNIINLDESSNSSLKQNDDSQDTRTRPLRQKRQSSKYSNSEFVADFNTVLETEKTTPKKSQPRPSPVNSSEKNKTPQKGAVSIPEKTNAEMETLAKKLQKFDKINQYYEKYKTKLNDQNKTSDKPKFIKKQTEPFETAATLRRSRDLGALVIPEKYMLPDLLIPVAHIQNHFRKTVFKSASSKHIFRLMTWENIRNHYRNGSLYIWYNPYINTGKLIATKTKENPLPAARYVDIKHFKNSPNSIELPEIVKGLISNQLPNKAFDAKNTFGIFVFSGQFWEIRGTMLKKSTDSPIVQSKDTEPPFQPKSVADLNLETKEVPLTVAEPEIVIDQRSPASIRVPIPIGQKDSRWFMLILENDFSVLRVQNSKLCMKYSQLKQACQLAMKVARTVRFLIPRKDQVPDPHNPAFGGYAVPGLLERIFFGPYGLNEDHGIMTYRYINGKLVETKQAEKLYGRESKKSKGIWLYTKGIKSVDGVAELNAENPQKDVAIVDLTEDDDELQETPKSNVQPDSEWNSVAKKKTFVSPDMKIRRIPIEQDPLSTQSDLSLVSNNNQKTSDLQMPVLEKMDTPTQPERKKPTKMPTLQPIHKMPTLQPINDINSTAKTLNECPAPSGATNSLPIYYDSRRSSKVKRTAKNKPTTTTTNTKNNDDDLEIISTTISTTPKDRTMWLISELPNLGYIEIKTHSNGKISLQSPTNKRVMEFSEMSLVIDWIDQLLRSYICFVPVDFQIPMYLVDDQKNIVGRKPLEETELRGYHLICAKGLFDITELTPLRIEDLGISNRERDNILRKQEDLTVQKYIYQLGAMFLPVETMRSMLHETIVNMASPAIRRLQKENIKLKNEKNDLAKVNEQLQQRLTTLSKELNLNEAEKQEILSKVVPLDSDDDDVIIVEETSTGDTEEKDPLAITVEDTLKISNVTSLSEEYLRKQSESTPAETFQPIDRSCKIVNGKKYSPARNSNRKKIENPPKPTPPAVVDFENEITKNFVPKTMENVPKTVQNVPKTVENAPKTVEIAPKTVENVPKTVENVPNSTTQTQPPAMYAPITLPNGQSVLVPIVTSSPNQTLIIQSMSSTANTQTSTNSTSQVQVVARKRTSLLDHLPKKSTSNVKKQSAATSSLTNTTFSTVVPRKIQKTQSILKKNVNAAVDDSLSVVTESEIIEID